MAKEQWKNDIAYAMTPYKLITWPIGGWPLQVYDTYSLLRCILSVGGSSIMVILPSMELLLGCTNVEQNILCLTVICAGLLGMLKATWFRMHANSLINNYESALKDYLTIDNTKERDIMRKYAYIGRIFCVPMLGVTYFTCLLDGITPIYNYLQSNRINVTNEDIILEYAVPITCTLEYLHIPNNIFITLSLVELGLLLLAISTDLGNDALFTNIALHICGQVNILRINFINFDVTSPRICDRFNALIQRHRYLIIRARELTDLISFVLLIQLMIVGSVLCIMEFQLVLALKNNNIAVIRQSSTLLIAMLSQLLLFSFVGNSLKSEMEDIGLSVYESAWYNFPKKLTKNVIFILLQTKYPVTLQAGNFVINFITYLSILKTSFSYLSVLRVTMEV